METDFSEEGIRKAIDWLNELWEAEPEKWLTAKNNWQEREYWYLSLKVLKCLDAREQIAE